MREKPGQPRLLCLCPSCLPTMYGENAEIRGGVPMVVVYLKNGEKAPIMDANYVRIEGAEESPSSLVLRCFFGDAEVGHFRWEEVAGYTISKLQLPNLGSNDAWTARLEAQA
jgi:hypothetical protein